MRTFTPRLLMLALLSAAACDSTTGSTDDASFPTPDSAVVAPYDGAVSTFDAGSYDAGFNFDASILTYDGSIGSFGDGALGDATLATDATLGDATVASDAGDAGSKDAGGDSAVATGPGVCGGSTPHGCWKPKAGNDVNCPPQIHEQSALYPPAAEWVACSSPYYQACIYLRPDGTEANCSCDLGLHWLCTY